MAPVGVERHRSKEEHTSVVHSSTAPKGAKGSSLEIDVCRKDKDGRICKVYFSLAI